jgi:FkbM family methyltransferase
MTDSTYYSQFGEDRALSGIFGGKRDGLCVEVGANDGINDSNSMHFEGIGWQCILVEPNPALCEMIRRTRSAALYEVAASGQSGETSLFIAEGAERAHGVSTINSDEGALDKIKSYGFSIREVRVKTRPLDDILVESKVSRPIDFISIDVEGHELEVLKGFSIDRWKPTIMLIEDNSNFSDATVADYLRTFGYVPFMRTGVNDWYAASSNSELVNMRTTGARQLILFRARAEEALKRVPGLVALSRFVRKRFR